MNETERLILEALEMLLGQDSITCHPTDQQNMINKINKALAPQSDEQGFEKDVEESSSTCSSKSVEKKE